MTDIPNIQPDSRATTILEAPDKTVSVRELFGSGSLFGIEILPLVSNGGWYQGNGLMLLAPSAFFIIGFLIWIVRTKRVEQVEKNEFQLAPHTTQEVAH